MAFVLLVISPPKLPPGFVPGFPLPVTRKLPSRLHAGSTRWWAPFRVTLCLMAYVFLVISPRCFRSLVGSSGLEPPTSRLSGVRSNHLSYEPICLSAGRPFLSGPFSDRLHNLTGGDERVRTDDPLLAKQVLSQLSYTPI